MSTEKPYGERNPIKKKRVGEALHGSTISASRILQDMMLDKTNEYALEGQRYYKGEVLYAYTDAQGAVHVKARIPEINILPLPTSLPEANDSKADADWATISLYPTFVAFNAQVSQMGIPSPGEIVYLDYEHVLTFDGPLYMGPVNIGAMPVPEAARPSSQPFDGRPLTDTTGSPQLPGRNVATRFDKGRILALAQRTGIDPYLLAALQQQESSGIAETMAFNPWIMRSLWTDLSFPFNYRRDIEKIRDLIQRARRVGLADSSSTVKKPSLGNPRSLYGRRAREGFTTAYEQVDAITAVGGAAWGNYQVLGQHSLKHISSLRNADDPAAEFMRRFNENPGAFSDDMFADGYIPAVGGKRGLWYKATQTFPGGVYRAKIREVQRDLTGAEYFVLRYYGGVDGDPNSSRPNGRKYHNSLLKHYYQFKRERIFE
mgnify:FL=1